MPRRSDRVHRRRVKPMRLYYARSGQGATPTTRRDARSLRGAAATGPPPHRSVVHVVERLIRLLPAGLAVGRRRRARLVAGMRLLLPEPVALQKIVDPFLQPVTVDPHLVVAARFASSPAHFRPPCRAAPRLINIRLRRDAGMPHFCQYSSCQTPKLAYGLAT